MGGAFLTSREIFENPIWQDVIKFRLFFYIVGNAVFSTEGVRIGNINLERGQFLRSYRNLAKDLEYLDNRAIKSYSISVIKKKVDQLVKENRLKVEDTELGTLFTVVNYAQYQGFERYKSTTENAARTDREQGENNNNKDIKDIKKTSCPKYEISDMENAELLFSLMLENNPKVRKPKFENWADDFRKIRKIDKRTDEQIKYLIRWSQKDSFWMANIQSPGKLRDKWDQLVLRAKQDHEKKKDAPTPATKTYKPMEIGD